ncbi:hypothetical protein AVEN_215092-1 [Araneus ventricosus]|uniref:Uncharacterized protein n=1 Tax=Araneus ventricosus TaxID=182803 RepID=A0A4Y2X1G0_ARAVE|nr:hypothetical protein AVEN_215092-1 [Araneus ventricosus]
MSRVIGIGGSSDLITDITLFDGDRAGMVIDWCLRIRGSLFVIRYQSRVIGIGGSLIPDPKSNLLAWRLRWHGDRAKSLNQSIAIRDPIRSFDGDSNGLGD